ncbi:DNA repair protein [Deinococcus sp. AJ005]|uniref:DNA repair protein n=1 Tax=Deinococcus sp. AJ005 TaxID=2652443 RepID=UPI00125CBD70|nr:DNA repair protein [Deinococcus sp. AJ005]QFP75213.1 DNA repair protein [Deinococcus sp. AJ005]
MSETTPRQSATRQSGSRRKDTPAPAPSDAVPSDATGFQRLLTTAQIDADVTSIVADPATADAQLTALLRVALDRWGYSLHHLEHRAALTDTGEIQLFAGKTLVGRTGEDAEHLARSYASLGAPNADGLSDWSVLGEGWRTTIKSAAQLRVLIEDARDFETMWTPERGLFLRIWRRTEGGQEVTATEYAQPVNATQLLGDAAWDAIQGIKDRALQRELMERSAKGGLLQAFLSARHKDAERNLGSLPETHFTVQSSVTRLTGEDARDFAAVRAAQKTTADELRAMQERAVKGMVELLRSDLR